METTRHLLTPESLKVLAHPLRVKLLGELRLAGPATATQLAAKIGESSGTTSYHLRQLAAADFVVEDTERGNARDRWWKAAQDSTQLNADDWLDSPSMRPAFQTYMTAVIQGNMDRAWKWLQVWSDASKKWRDSATFSDARLSLSAAELLQLNEDIEKLIESRRREPKRGDKSVTIQWQSFPLDDIA
ncbi:MAG: Transcriptional regulator, ArsR family [Frankiales bacterium]|nr:Transcriptional regulator, ArsR family [Frankiales bacterium]